MKEREPIGLKDKDGRELRLGDVVEFFYCAEHGPSADPQECGGRIVGVIYREDLQTPIPGHVAKTYLIAMATLGTAYAWKFSAFSRVVGALPKDAEKFVDADPVTTFMPPALRAERIKQVRNSPLIVEVR